MTPDAPIERQVPTACRTCSNAPLVEVLDLGSHPEANTLPARGTDHEPRWPLRLFVCDRCWLVQLDDAGPPETALPGPRPYDLSETMRAHAVGFAKDVLQRAGSAPGELRVLEVASHGSYLQPFLVDRGIRSVILEAPGALAAVAKQDGYDVIEWDPQGAAEDGIAPLEPADLIVDNYLLAHLADPGRFLSRVRRLLAPSGALVLELAYVPPMLRDGAFDSIRHGHFSYLSLTALVALLERHDFTVTDVAPQPVYGGALRVFASPSGGGRPVRRAVAETLADEAGSGVSALDTYRGFAERVSATRRELVAFLRRIQAEGAHAVGYGAPSRASTLLNYCGITTDLMPFTVDRSIQKQGRFVPGCGIPVRSPDEIGGTKPDYVVVLTWDIAAEVQRQLREVESWGGRFFVPLPRPRLMGAT